MDTQLAQLEALFWETARGTLDRAAVTRAFRSHGELDAAARMAIYRDMYFARQVRALSVDFPLVIGALGDRVFDDLAHAYIRAHPSESPALERVARKFVPFLRERGVSEEICELATLEWLACCALIAPPDPVLTFAEVAPESWPDARLRLNRSLALCEAGPRARSLFLGTRASSRERAGVVIFRHRFRVRACELADDEAHALNCIEARHTFGEVCGTFPSAERAATVVRSWFARAWIAGIEGATP